MQILFIKVNFKSTFAMGSIQEKNHSEENDDDIVQVQVTIFIFNMRFDNEKVFFKMSVEIFFSVFSSLFHHASCE